jgi:hypothetical protein
VDTSTSRRTSLRTGDEDEARQIIAAEVNAEPRNSPKFWH